MHSSALLVSLLLVAAPFTVSAFYDMYIVKEPHILSINNGYEMCDYYTATWFSCFDSPFFQVNGIFTQTSISASIKSYS